MKYISNSTEETKQIASEFAKNLKGGEVIFLEGDLGAGKTTFVQGAAKTLGYGGPVRSPTFTLMNIYPTDHQTIKRIVHIDFYRIKNQAEISALGLDEWLNDPSSVIFIEWPFVEGFFASPSFRIKMDKKSNNICEIYVNDRMDRDWQAGNT